jgi:hypothetical protein
MRNIARAAPYYSAADSFTGRVAVWNRRLLIFAVVVLLWGSSVLALQKAGPNAQAMLAGEGMLITSSE